MRDRPLPLRKQRMDLDSKPWNRWFVFAMVAGVVGLALFAFVFSFTLTAAPTPKPAPVVSPVPRNDFEQRFVEPSVVPVRAIPIVPTPAPAPSPSPLPQETVAAAVPPVAQPPVVKRATDICTRNKLRKVFTNGGRSWRCRK